MQNNRTSRTSVIFKAFKDTLPVMTGYLALGIGFGILLSTKGYGILWAFLMGILIYSGTMQFVAIDLITAPASLATTAFTALILSARHLFYGISMLKSYENSGFLKPYLIYTLTDETYSLVCTSKDTKYCFWVSLFDHSYWVTGSVLGAALGSLLNLNANGIDFSLTALFLTICTEQWLNSENHLSALTGFFASLISLLIFGQENFLIPAMFLIVIALWFLKRKFEHE